MKAWNPRVNKEDFWVARHVSGLYDFSSRASTKEECREHIMRAIRFKDHETWREAYKLGWRLVKISVIQR